MLQAHRRNLAVWRANRAAFFEADSDGNGRLEGPQLSTALAALDLKLSSDQQERYVAKITAHALRLEAARQLTLRSAVGQRQQHGDSVSSAGAEDVSGAGRGEGEDREGSSEGVGYALWIRELGRMLARRKAQKADFIAG